MTQPESHTCAVRAALKEMDPDARLVTLWRDAPCVPLRAPVLHAVFAYPSRRIATMRHWRDTLEQEVDGLPLVAHEASKWARLLLKGHAGAKAIVLHEPSSDMLRFGAALAEVAERIEGDDIDAWREQAGWSATSRHPQPLLTGQARFEALETWLVSVRVAIDAAAQ